MEGGKEGERGRERGREREEERGREGEGRERGREKREGERKNLISLTYHCNPSVVWSHTSLNVSLAHWRETPFDNKDRSILKEEEGGL